MQLFKWCWQVHFIALAPRSKLHDEETKVLAANNIPILRSARECTQVVASSIKYSQGIEKSKEPRELSGFKAPADVKEMKDGCLGQVRCLPRLRVRNFFLAMLYPLQPGLQPSRPITRRDAEEIINEVRGKKILEAFRGKPTADVNGIIDTLLKLSRLSIDLQDVVSEIGIDPSWL